MRERHTAAVLIVVAALCFGADRYFGGYGGGYSNGSFFTQSMT